jgi:hypothetical protein
MASAKRKERVFANIGYRRQRVRESEARSIVRLANSIQKHFGKNSPRTTLRSLGFVEVQK